MKATKVDSPEEFFSIIPTNILENLEFRKELHALLDKDSGFQRVFRQMLLDYPPLFYNSIAWTFNPKMPPGERNRPFILRPKQLPAVLKFNEWYKTGVEGVVDKSREEGATELITKFLAMQWLLSEEFTALMGSRREDLVDSRTQILNDRVIGDTSCLFHKVLYAIHYCPAWLKPKEGEFNKTYLMLQNYSNGAVIKGESTTENFGAGARHSIVFVDEIGRLESYRLAEGIIETLGPVSNCVIYCSTHFYGVAHPYNKLLTGKFGHKDIIVLDWESNPEKNVGMYISPEPGKVQIRDIEYYRQRCPKVFNSIEAMEVFNPSQYASDLDLAGISFVDDGGDSNEGGWRSLWYDAYARDHSARDVAQNVDRRPIGAGDIFFSPATLRRIEVEHCREPEYIGDLSLGKDDQGRITSATFVNLENGNLAWWGALPDGRPDQTRNYILAGDISRGTGATNSVIGIYDTADHVKIGCYVTPHMSPEDFADITAGLWHWVGGISPAYVIWEAQGPGELFGKRLVFNRVYPLYEDRDTTKFHSPRKKRYGWQSSASRKYDAMIALDAALAAGVAGNTHQKRLLIYDVQAIREYETYINLPNGGVGPAHSITDSSGARRSHGDRVITDMLYIVAADFQLPLENEQHKKYPLNSFGRRLENRIFQAQNSESNRRFIY